MTSARDLSREQCAAISRGLFYENFFFFCRRADSVYNDGNARLREEIEIHRARGERGRGFLGLSARVMSFSFFLYYSPRLRSQVPT